MEDCETRLPNQDQTKCLCFLQVFWTRHGMLHLARQAWFCNNIWRAPLIWKTVKRVGLYSVRNGGGSTVNSNSTCKEHQTCSIVRKKKHSRGFQIPQIPIAHQREDRDISLGWEANALIVFPLGIWWPTVDGRWNIGVSRRTGTRLLDVHKFAHIFSPQGTFTQLLDNCIRCLVGFLIGTIVPQIPTVRGAGGLTTSWRPGWDVVTTDCRNRNAEDDYCNTSRCISNGHYWNKSNQSNQCDPIPKCSKETWLRAGMACTTWPCLILPTARSRRIRRMATIGFPSQHHLLNSWANNGLHSRMRASLFYQQSPWPLLQEFSVVTLCIMNGVYVWLLILSRVRFPQLCPQLLALGCWRC